MRGSPRRTRRHAAPSAHSLPSCAPGSRPKDMSWSPMMAILARGWIGRVWMRCATLRRPAGVIEAVWCLSPDRLARMYAYQVIVLDELNRQGVRVLFTDAPALDDDP